MNVKPGCKNTHRVVLLWCKLVSSCKFRSSSFYLSWVENWSTFLPLRNSIFLFRDEINGCQKAKNGVLDLSFPPSKVLPTCCTSFFTTKNCEKDTRRALIFHVAEVDIFAMSMPSASILAAWAIKHLPPDLKQTNKLLFPTTCKYFKSSWPSNLWVNTFIQGQTFWNVWDVWSQLLLSCRLMLTRSCAHRNSLKR